MVKIKIRWFLENDSPLTVCAWLPNNGGQCVGTNRLPSVSKGEADTATKKLSREKFCKPEIGIQNQLKQDANSFHG